ncbi:MAG TPA: heme biosynthesis HemY N-terminal domain-containing protein [Steroidobacteraceae bacterium]|nr:heme biosynthesis HemY N-terminal domain-containing protein [Steroidobacteraceae bacterium]
MKAGLYVAGALLLGAVLAQVLFEDPGYVAVSFRGYLVEMSVPVLVLSLVAAYLVVRLIVRLWTARRSLARAREHRTEDRARRSLVTGLLELAEGNCAAAEQTLTRSASEGEAAAAHFLAAARAAELQGATERRDRWIAKALEAAPTESAPARITQAEFQIKHKQFEFARTTLEELDAAGQQNPRGVLLLARVYRHLGLWDKLEALEPQLRRLKSLPSGAREDIVAQIHLEHLETAGKTRDRTQLEQAWNDTPRPLTQRPDIVVAYARSAMQCGQHAAAEKALRSLLEKHWEDAAVHAYGDVETDDALATLETAEGWLHEHADDATLLLACAKLAMRAELYGKARSFLEASLAIRPRLEAYQLLASLMEQTGDRDRAIKALSDALALAVGRRPTLPRIRKRVFAERRRGADRRHAI